MMIQRVISGGQTGVDVGGIKAAKLYGIETGGWMPKGFRTLQGNCPQYAELYGFKEHPEYSYIDRTYANVRDSDGTIRIASNHNSAGEKCTLRAIREYNKQYKDVKVIFGPGPFLSYLSEDEVVEWIIQNNIKILNIAGNSEFTQPGIEKFTIKYMSRVFEELGFEKYSI